MIFREVIRHVLEKKHFHKRYIDAIKDMYDGSINSVKETYEEKLIRFQLH